MRQIQTLAEQLQRHTRHDARRHGKHGPIHPILGLPIAIARAPEPQRRDSGSERLRQSSQHERGGHGGEAVVEREVEGEGEGETFGDVVDEEGEEDGEAEFGVGVVGGVGDEALGEFVQGDGDGGLEAEGEEGVGGDVVVVAWFAGLCGVRGCCGGVGVGFVEGGGGGVGWWGWCVVGVILMLCVLSFLVDITQ